MCLLTQRQYRLITETESNVSERRSVHEKHEEPGRNSFMLCYDYLCTSCNGF